MRCPNRRRTSPAGRMQRTASRISFFNGFFAGGRPDSFFQNRSRNFEPVPHHFAQWRGPIHQDERAAAGFEAFLVSPQDFRRGAFGGHVQFFDGQEGAGGQTNQIVRVRKRIRLRQNR